MWPCVHFIPTWQTCYFQAGEEFRELWCWRGLFLGWPWPQFSRWSGAPGRRRAASSNGRPRCQWTSAGWRASRCSQWAEDMKEKTAVAWVGGGRARNFNSCEGSRSRLKVWTKKNSAAHRPSLLFFWRESECWDVSGIPRQIIKSRVQFSLVPWLGPAD